MSSSIKKNKVLAIIDYKINYYDFEITNKNINIISKKKYFIHDIRTIVDNQNEYTIYFKKGEYIIIFDKELYDFIYSLYIGRCKL